jgi:hypothetical protein
MPSDGDSADLTLLAKIRQLEDETARLRLLIAELLIKNQQLRERPWWGDEIPKTLQSNFGQD